MSDKISVHIITPDKVVFSKSVDAVTLPGQLGEMELLPGHVPLFSILKPGQIVVKDKGLVKNYAVGPGFMEIANDKVSIIVDTAEGSHEIDVASAKALIDAAEDKLKAISSEDVEERFAFETELAVARAQIAVYERSEENKEKKAITSDE